MACKFVLYEASGAPGCRSPLLKSRLETGHDDNDSSDDNDDNNDNYNIYIYT